MFVLGSALCICGGFEPHIGGFGDLLGACATADPAVANYLLLLSLFMAVVSVFSAALL
ncbi:hypothetical protein [Candidatus Ichthyocystis sparus]|uniref:hypothetical protein n=1 Tax=Candidatus Ichthyocystis sparus TaxID=1561004 RepID=UPI00159ECAA0|nr:hypothetical protein [Candidatus Ichthyocystis sparus]